MKITTLEKKIYPDYNLQSQDHYSKTTQTIFGQEFRKNEKLTFHGRTIRILSKFASLSFRSPENNVSKSIHNSDPNQVVPRQDRVSSNEVFGDQSGQKGKAIVA